MNKKNIESQFHKLKNIIVSALQEKKAENIISIDFGNMNNPHSDMFIVCHGNSKRQVEALADFVDEKVREELREKPNHIEGMENKEWILLDYFDIIVHIFVEDKRDFYAIEELWGDGQVVSY